MCLIISHDAYTFYSRTREIETIAGAVNFSSEHFVTFTSNVHERKEDQTVAITAGNCI